MDKKKYGRLAFLWVVLAVGSAFYFERTQPDTLMRYLVITSGILAGLGATIQYFYHLRLLDKKHTKRENPQK